jgi:voltage-gated potassium channel
VRRPSQGALPEWRFLQLTLVICGWMLLSPQLSDRWLVHLLLQVFLLNTVLITLWANPQWRHIRSALIGLWLVSLAGSLLALVPQPGESPRLLARCAEIASLVPLCAILAFGMLRFVFRERRLTVDGIFATVAAYLVVALMFAQVYLLMLAWNPDSFTLPVAAADRSPHLLQNDMTYFSLVTLATVGYGDILPRSETARMMAMIEAVVGQFYVAVIVAVFVGMYANQRRN